MSILGEHCNHPGSRDFPSVSLHNKELAGLFLDCNPGRYVDGLRSGRDGIKGDYSHLEADFFLDTELFELQSGLKQGHLSSYNVTKGEFPDAKTVRDSAYIVISGSPYNIKDNIVFITQLQKFVRECKLSQKPILGICFGHQIIGSSLFGNNVVLPVNELLNESTVLGSRNIQIINSDGSNCILSESDTFSFFNSYGIPNDLLFEKRINSYGKYGNMSCITDWGDNVMSFQFHPEQIYNCFVECAASRDYLISEGVVNEDNFINLCDNLYLGAAETRSNGASTLGMYHQTLQKLYS